MAGQWNVGGNGKQFRRAGLGLKPLSGNNLATTPPIHPLAINTFTKKIFMKNMLRDSLPEHHTTPSSAAHNLLKRRMQSRIENITSYSLLKH